MSGYKLVPVEGLRYTFDGALAECPCCGSLDVGGAHDTVHCQGCGLTVTKPRPLQNAIDAWNARTGRTRSASPAVQGEPVAEEVTLLECVSCNHLYQGQVTQCDCMPDEQKFNRWLARPEQQPAPISRNLRGVHAMILNALDRDAADGKAVRGEMAAELRSAIAEQQPAPDVSALVEALEEALELISDTDPNEGTAWFHEIAYKALAAHRKGDEK